jgi:hypothetical protein
MHHETSHSALRKATVNEIEIAYDTFVDPQGQPMLLSTGWRGQHDETGPGALDWCRPCH